MALFKINGDFYETYNVYRERKTLEPIGLDVRNNEILEAVSNSLFLDMDRLSANQVLPTISPKALNALRINSYNFAYIIFMLKLETCIIYYLKSSFYLYIFLFHLNCK